MIEKEEIMNDLIISESKTKITKSICPAKTHNAVCTGVDDLGLQLGYKNGKPIQKIVLRFEVEQLIDNGPLMGEPYCTHTIVNFLVCENSKLKKILIDWGYYSCETNNKPTSYRLNELVGKPAIITVNHTKKENGEIASEITCISKHIHGLQILTPSLASKETPKWIKAMEAKRLDKPIISGLLNAEAMTNSLSEPLLARFSTVHVPSERQNDFAPAIADDYEVVEFYDDFPD